jgi:hypothetical protein
MFILMGGFMTHSKRRFTLLAVLGAAVMMLATMASAAQAREPAPGYTQFAGCPSPEENAETAFCIRSDVTGGHLNVGNKEVPIENPLTISGGLNNVLANFAYNSQGGLSKTPQKVPGGVVGLTGLTWLLELFGSEALTLYATTELAGTPGKFSFSSVTLPIKVHLTNPGGLLGSTCYLGSNSEPIVLNLITGTTNPPPPNEPITGNGGEISEDELEILHIKNGVYVDNSFAAPGVNGCKLVLFGIPIGINGLVDEISELPSPAGTNESVQDFNLELVEQELVYP